MSSSNKNGENSKAVGFKANNVRIDDRTITRRTKGSSQMNDPHVAQSEVTDDSSRFQTYRAQSAKDRGTSR